MNKNSYGVKFKLISYGHSLWWLDGLAYDKYKRLSTSVSITVVVYNEIENILKEYTK